MRISLGQILIFQNRILSGWPSRWLIAIRATRILSGVFLLKESVGTSWTLSNISWTKQPVSFWATWNTHISGEKKDYYPPSPQKVAKKNESLYKPRKGKHTKGTPVSVHAVRSQEGSSKRTKQATFQAGALWAHMSTVAHFLLASLWVPQPQSPWGRVTWSLGCYFMCGMCVLPSVVLALFTGNYGARLFDIKIPITEALKTFESRRCVTLSQTKHLLMLV